MSQLNSSEKLEIGSEYISASLGPFPEHVRTATYGFLEYPSFCLERDNFDTAMTISRTEDEWTRACDYFVSDIRSGEREEEIVISGSSGLPYTTFAITADVASLFGVSVVTQAATCYGAATGLALTVRGPMFPGVVLREGGHFPFYVKHTRHKPVALRADARSRLEDLGGFLLSTTNYTLSPGLATVEASRTRESVVGSLDCYTFDLDFEFAVSEPSTCARTVRFPLVTGRYARVQVQAHPMLIGVDIGGTTTVGKGSLPSLIVPVSGKVEDKGVTFTFLFDTGGVGTTAKIKAVVQLA